MSGIGRRVLRYVLETHLAMPILVARAQVQEAAVLVLSCPLLSFLPVLSEPLALGMEI